jgi:hypothetical protein
MNLISYSIPANSELYRCMFVHKGANSFAYNMRQALKYAQYWSKLQQDDPDFNKWLINNAIDYALNHAKEFIEFYNNNIEFKDADTFIKAKKVYDKIMNLKKV